MNYHYTIAFATPNDTVKFECDTIDAVMSIIEMIDLYAVDGEWKVTISREAEK